jgi:hypothetical protein
MTHFSYRLCLCAARQQRRATSEQALTRLGSNPMPLGRVEVKTTAPQQEPMPPSSPSPSAHRVWHDSRRFVVYAAVVTVALALGLFATHRNGVDAARRQPARPTASAPNTSEPASRCVAVPPALLKRLERGLTVSGVGRLRRAKAVKSSDFIYLYMVAADIESPGLEGGDDIAVWSTNSLQSGAPIIFAVDGAARAYSQWGTPGRDSNVHGRTHGVGEARECVRQAL